MAIDAPRPPTTFRKARIAPSAASPVAAPSKPAPVVMSV